MLSSTVQAMLHFTPAPARCMPPTAVLPAAPCPHRAKRRGQPDRRLTVVACGNSSRAAIDPGLELNSACNDALQAMLANDEQRAGVVQQQLRGLRLQALEAADLEADQLMRVLEGMLHHSVLKEAEELTGPYASALDRIINQVAGSEWKLVLEGQSAEVGQQEPQFSTWEEVLKKQQQRRAGAGAAGSPGSTASTDSDSSSSRNATAGGGSPAHTAFYRLLGVAPNVNQPDLRTAYRQLALKLHPDVNQAPDATQRFAEVAAAYDVLSDAASRSLYDMYGAEGMKQHAGASAGSGNAGRAWDEFKPYKRVNKRTKARDASAASYSDSWANERGDDSGPSSGENDGVAANVGAAPSSAAQSAAAHDPPASQVGTEYGGRRKEDCWAGMPQAGAVVEYPLSARVQQELQDGRTHGVGLLVGRNCDRGDAGRLPREVLDLCEVEPLRQQDPGSDRWVPDELSPSAFVRLGELRPVAVDSFDRAWDVWHITAPLSEGCGGPELTEEIML